MKDYNNLTVKIGLKNLKDMYKFKQKLKQLLLSNFVVAPFSRVISQIFIKKNIAGTIVYVFNYISNICINILHLLPLLQIFDSKNIVNVNS